MVIDVEQHVHDGILVIVNLRSRLLFLKTRGESWAKIFPQRFAAALHAGRVEDAKGLYCGWTLARQERKFCEIRSLDELSF